MSKILIAYTTNSGSTTEVAQAVAGELGELGAQPDVRRLEETPTVEGYAAVVIGAPMILGWHGAAQRFVRKHQRVLSRVPVAYFFTAMSLTRTDETSVAGVPVTVDERLAKPPKTARLSFKERYATVPNYLRPALKAAPQVKPVSAGFFGGKLEYYRLPLPAMLFVMLVIQATPGDFRNWPAIRAWANGLGAKFGLARAQ